MVPAPSFFTLASQDVRMLSSRSVAVIASWLHCSSQPLDYAYAVLAARDFKPECRFSPLDSAVWLESFIFLHRASLLIEQDPTRVPDHHTSGSDLTLNDNVRALLFGEY
jgi:hypothetical protein